MWQDTAMKPRRPTVKDSTQHLHGEGAKRKSAQVAARAARKADAKKRKLAEPHLIPDGNLQRCSVCGYPFETDVRPSMSAAFAEHLSKAHKPGQTTEDISQAAFRVVREATDKA